MAIRKQSGTAVARASMAATKKRKLVEKLGKQRVGASKPRAGMIPKRRAK